MRLKLQSELSHETRRALVLLPNDWRLHQVRALLQPNENWADCNTLAECRG